MAMILFPFLIFSKCLSHIRTTHALILSKGDQFYHTLISENPQNDFSFVFHKKKSKKQ